MVNITAASFKSLMNDADADEEKMESVIDAAINMLNLYGAELPNMTGTAGTKTVSLESKQAGAVQLVAEVIYNDFYKGIEATSVGGIAISKTVLLANPTVMACVKEAARRLTEIEVDVG